MKKQTQIFGLAWIASFCIFILCGLGFALLDTQDIWLKGLGFIFGGMGYAFIFTWAKKYYEYLEK